MNEQELRNEIAEEIEKFASLLGGVSAQGMRIAADIARGKYGVR